MKTILLDMDGVLADFFSPAMELFGCNLNVYLDTFSERPLEYNVGLWVQRSNLKYAHLGNPWETNSWFEQEVAIAARRSSFWYLLPLYPWADELVHLCAMYGDVYVCTKPMKHGECFHQKYLWMKRHFPQLAERLIITNHKQLLASPGVTLIDDFEDTIDKFSKVGNGILFPQHWNINHEIVLPSKRLQYVQQKLQELTHHETITQVASH